MLTAMCAWSFGQSPSFLTPKPGSPERKAIMDAMRPYAERSLRQKIKFVVNDLRVSGAWAFTQGSLQQSNGKPPDFSKSELAAQFAAGAGDNSYCGLLRKTNGRWKVRKLMWGMTDVPWGNWSKKFGAPRAIFP